MFRKRGWFYFRPTGKAAADEKRPESRSPAVALRTQDLATAVMLAEDLRGTEMVHRAAVKGTIREAVEDFMRTKARLEVTTRRHMRGVLDGFADIVGNVQVERISQAVIRRWVEHLLENGGRRGASRRDGKGGKGLAKGSVTSYLLALRVFIRWAMRQGMLREDPLVEFLRDMRVTETREERFLSTEERDRLLAVPMSLDLRWMMVLGFYQGFRQAEMLAMKSSWVWVSDDGQRGTVTVQATRVVTQAGKELAWQPKNKKKRTIPLHAETLRMIREHGLREPFVVAPHKERWPDEGKKSYRYDPKKSLRAAARAAGVGHVTYHMMRRSFATHLAAKGVGMKQIAEFIGDSLRVTEKHYISYAQNEGNPLDGL